MSSVWRREHEKTGYEHRTPVTAEALAVLEDARRKNPGIGDIPVLPAPKDPSTCVSRSLARDWWEKAQELAVHPHTNPGSPGLRQQVRNRKGASSWKRWLKLSGPRKEELRQDLKSLFQGAIRVTLEMVLEEELKAMVGARRFERVGSRKDHRNGTYLRRLLTSLGQIDVMGRYSGAGVKKWTR